MLKNAKYALMAFIFIGIAKLLQVSFLDADYKKSKKSSYTKPAVTAPAQKENEKLRPESEKIIAEETVSENNDKANDSEKMEPVSNENTQSVEETVSEVSNTNSSLEELRNTYLSPIISKLPTGQLREDVVIRYYRHEKDGDKVEILHDLGYYIHEKEATETAGFGSNVLYYGNSVPIEDIRIVALTLLEEGLSLKSIQRSRFDWKSNSLEIGTDMNLVDTSDVTVDYIMHFTK